MRRGPVWGYEDLVLLVGAILPSIAMGVLLARLLRALAPQTFAGPAAANPASASPVARTTANVERMIDPYAAGRAKPATCS